MLRLCEIRNVFSKYLNGQIPIGTEIKDLKISSLIVKESKL